MKQAITKQEIETVISARINTLANEINKWNFYLYRRRRKPLQERTVQSWTATLRSLEDEQHTLRYVQNMLFRLFEDETT